LACCPCASDSPPPPHEQPFGFSSADGGGWGHQPPPPPAISHGVYVMGHKCITAHHPDSVQFLCRNRDSGSLLIFDFSTLSGGVTACRSEESNYVSLHGQRQCVYKLSDADMSAFS
jgi:hypothetical protein